MRPKLTVHFDNPSPYSGSIEIDGKPVAVTSLELTAKPGEPVQAFMGLIPNTVEVDLDAACVRLCGAQLPDDVGRALYEQLKALYGRG